MTPFNIISATSVSEAVYTGLATANQQGVEKACRNGGSVFIRNATFHVQDPRARHLSLAGRKSNIFQMIAETFWVMAGEGNIRDFLTFFLPRAPQYSDDGQTWHGAYGPRIYAQNQVQDAITLLQESPDTRRAIIMIADPNKDSRGAIYKQYSSTSPKDIPCNREIHLNVIEGKLNMKVIQRSGDLLFGAGSINPFEFTFLQELLSETTGYGLGDYQWNVTDAHYYNSFKDQVESVLGQPQAYAPSGDLPLGTKFRSADEMKLFFSGVLDIWRQQMDFSFTMAETHSALNDRLAKYAVRPDGQLANYIRLVTFYIASKLGEIDESFTAALHNISANTDLGQAVLASPFRKFDVALGS